nr:immunoglobulin heavy chain junction region [Mus musculus]
CTGYYYGSWYFDVW